MHGRVSFAVGQVKQTGGRVCVRRENSGQMRMLFSVFYEHFKKRGTSQIEILNASAKPVTTSVWFAENWRLF